MRQEFTAREFNESIMGITNALELIEEFSLKMFLTLNLKHFAFPAVVLLDSAHMSEKYRLIIFSKAKILDG